MTRKWEVEVIETKSCLVVVSADDEIGAQDAALQELIRRDSPGGEGVETRWEFYATSLTN